MISFRFVAYFFFLYQIIIKFIHQTCFIIMASNYPSWLYLTSLADLILVFYENEEIYILKILSNIIILFTLSYIIVHYIIHFNQITGMVRIVVLSDISRFLLYLIYSCIDGYFYNSGLKELYKSRKLWYNYY